MTSDIEPGTCKHPRTYTTDIGFVMCSDCEEILATPAEVYFQ